MNWLQYLQDKAENGDEKALEVLRSKKEVDRNEEVKIRNSDNYSEKLIERENYLKRQYGILSNNETSSQSKKKLLAIEIMRKVAGRFSYKVDTSGNIIFSFENGGKIIDSGHKISFSDNIRIYGLLYAQLRYGIDSKHKDKFKSNQITLQSVIELREQKKKQEKKQEHSVQNNIGWSR